MDPKDSSMPPPPRPSPQKRAKMSSGTSSASASSVFTPATMLQAKLLAGNVCWACGASSALDVAHVIAQEDNAKQLLSKMGLFNFGEASVENAVVLCSTCHTVFDNALDPGFIFFPADLDYFIKFEKDDYESRLQQGRLGIRQPRRCPGNEMYKHHQEEQAQISTDASVGGLYQLVLLRNDYLPTAFGPLRSLTEINQHHPPKPWHGAPMATLRRAFVALGSLRIDIIPGDVRKKLQELQLLYTCNPPIAEVTSNRDQVAPVISQKRPRPDEPLPGGERSKSQPGPPSLGIRGATRSGREYSRYSNSYNAEADGRQWILGPNCSSMDAAKRYSHVFLSSKEGSI